MKNLKVFKSGISLLTAAAISLSCVGCGSDTEVHEEKEVQKNCKHLIINFSNDFEIFKECEGYVIRKSTSNGTGYFNVYKDDVEVLYGSTLDYLYLEINHDYIDDAFPEREEFQKRK